MKQILVAVALLGCSKKQDAPPAPAPEPSVRHDLGKLFEACWAAWSDGTDGPLRDCYATTAVSESPGAGFPPATQVSAILEAAKGFKTAFPDLVGKPQLVLVNETKVAAVVRLSGTKAETKKPFGLLGGVVDNFDASDKITHESDYFDSLTIQGQLDPQPSHLVRAWDATSSLVKQTIVAKHDAAEQANVDVVKAMVAAFNRHDLAAFGALIADDATWSEHAERADWNKAELLRDREAGIKGFPDLAIRAQDTWGAGDFVVEVAELTGTNDGPMPGIATPTHKQLAVPFLAIHHVVAGRVAHTWVFQQASAFVTQLGLK
ncbi:hypothetical protein BH11MYX1_BH11MYX1_46030 [soil metagenome]